MPQPDLKTGGANTSTGLKDTYYSRDEALAVANGRPVIAGKTWAGQELVTTYYVHTPSRSLPRSPNQKDH